MGLADLFKSKTAQLKADASIRWFGKLPTYADYYCSRTDEAWTVEFHDWILKGYETYQKRRPADGRRAGRLPLAGGVVRLPQSGMTVLASIQDYGGDMRGRPFPICFYVGFPTAQWPGPTSSRLAPASRVVRDLMVLGREVSQFLRFPGRFETHFGQRGVDLSGIDRQTQDDSWIGQARKIPLRDWFAGVKSGLNIDNPQAWVRVVALWGDKIARLESDTFEPTLRLPLAAGLPVEVQTAGWLRWLESRMDLEQRTLSLLVSGEPERGVGHLSVIAREVAPEDFLLVTNAAGALSYLDDLSKVTPAKVEGENGAEAGGPPPDSSEPAGTWADFVAGVTATA